jgi:hypothetical protein
LSLLFSVFIQLNLPWHELFLSSAYFDFHLPFLF